MAITFSSFWDLETFSSSKIDRVAGPLFETKFLACSESGNNHWNKKGVSMIWAFKLWDTFFCVLQA